MRAGLSGQFSWSSLGNAALWSGDWTRAGQAVTDSLRCLAMDAGCHMCHLSPAGQPQPIDTMPAFKENKS